MAAISEAPGGPMTVLTLLNDVTSNHGDDDNRIDLATGSNMLANI